jgi:hypothetical protein
VQACDENPDLIGTSVECEAIDFSIHGMPLKTAQLLPASTRLNITIGIGEPFSMHTLQGQIRWARMVQDHICMGVLLGDVIPNLHHSISVDYRIERLKSNAQHSPTQQRDPTFKARIAIIGIGKLVISPHTPLTVTVATHGQLGLVYRLV